MKRSIFLLVLSSAMMVVLMVGVSLSGYVAWRLTLARHGLWLTGLLGGLASSTATTLYQENRAHRPVFANGEAETAPAAVTPP